MRITLVILCLSFALSGTSQDEHFSQFYALPMLMNPALTGAYDGSYRMGAVYRDQWNNSLESPFRTFAVGGDTQLNLDYGAKKAKDKVGIGLFFISDKIAEFQSNTNQLSAYGAYHKRLSEHKKSYLGAGIKIGIIQKNVNYDNLNFQDQFNQIDEFSGATMEVLPPNNYGAMDMSIGINYYKQGDKSTLHLGVGYHHFNEPNISFFEKLDVSERDPKINFSQTLKSRLVVHVGWDRELSYGIQIQPRLVYQTQGAHNQLDLGTNLEYTFKSQNNALIIGLWATTSSDLDGAHLENLTPLLGIRQKQFIFGFSYDIHMRDAFSSPFGFNTFEFSIRFSGEHTVGGAFCPTF